MANKFSTVSGVLKHSFTNFTSWFVGNGHIRQKLSGHKIVLDRLRGFRLRDLNILMFLAVAAITNWSFQTSYKLAAFF